jgi:hypothetical protein
VRFFCFFSSHTKTDGTAEEIEKFRRKAQRMTKRALLFMDETRCMSNSVPHYSLASPGQRAHVQVVNETFGLRLDVIDSCAVDALGPYRIITPSDRVALGVKGITKDMFLDFFETMMVPFASFRFEPKNVFVVDKARIHDLNRMYDVAAELMPDTTVEVWTMPTNSAKFLSPLDNGFHAELQQGFAELIEKTDRSENAAVECVHSFMRSNGGANLHSYYRHCGLTSPSHFVSRL